MRPALLRLRLTWTLALVAWFAQLCLPVAHAAMPASPHGPAAAWCGDPSSAQEALALLPAEIRDALTLDAISVDHLAQCAKLCAVGATPAPLAAAVRASLPQASGSALAPARQAPVAERRYALLPPSHGPPARA